MGLFDQCMTYSFAAHVLGSLAFFWMFIGSILSMIMISCIAVSAYMFVFSLAVGTLEAPSIMKVCETPDTRTCWASFSRIIGKFTGVSRTILYIGGMFPLMFCIDITTIFAALLLVGSGFFYLADWLGPRGGARQEAPDGTKEDLLSDAEREEAQIGGDGEAVSDNTPAWARFVDNATNKVTQAVAAAAVDQAKKDMDKINPFASLNQASGPLDAEAGASDDKEGNPFV